MEKEDFYDLFEEILDQCPSHDIKVIVGDMNVKVRRETIYSPKTGRRSLHKSILTKM